MSKIFTSIDVIRRENTKKLMEDMKLTRAEFAATVDVGYALLGHYIGKNPTKSIGDEVARRIEEKTGKPAYWLDHDHVGIDTDLIPEGTERLDTDGDMLPVISWVAAGSWTEVDSSYMNDFDSDIPRPKDLSKHSFGLVVRGRSMWPEFKPGEVIIVEPNVGLGDLIDGDLVVVQCNDDNEATFKQLVLGDNAEDMYLKPLNPDWPEQEMRPMSECMLVGKVVGKYTRY